MARGRQKAELPPVRPKVEAKTEGLVGALAIQEAPVFYPTEEEFQDPLQYISKIRPQAEPYGICRIIPPESWDPPFALDQQKFSFPTKLQAIHQLQERPAACDAETFKLEYERYLLKEGRTPESWPIFDGEELDLCKLFNAVKRHGGFEKVKQEKKWVEVIRMVRPKTTISSLCMQSSASGSASVILCQLYEKYLASYEVYQSSAGAMKHSRTPRQLEAKMKCKGKRAGRRGQLQNETDIETEGLGHGRKRHLQEGGDPAGVEGSKAGVLSPEGKRLKVEEGVGGVEREGRSDQICEQCNSGAHEQMMLLCDRCDRGWHLYCLSPPLSAVPHGNWYCLDCVASERDSFGFSQGQKYSLEAFRRMADRFKKKWFGSCTITYPDLEREFWRVVERATAPVEVLYGSDLDVSVYGSGFPRKSDIGAVSRDPAWERHANNPWNLNNFPKLNGSMLRLVDDNIPGVIVPWVYVGMLFSSFCWHYEDHCFYSVNYMHWGEPKTWYSVPGSAAEAFEQVMRKTFPDLFEAQPDLLFQLVTMLNPVVLRENGVPVCTTVQEPRNFVITFPKSYHGGFNHGFNCAEAVNFAPVDWLPYGSFAIERYRLYHKSAVLSHDELLCVIARNDGGARAHQWLEDEVGRLIATERSQREQLWKAGLVKSSRMTPRSSPEHVGTEEDPECIICRYYLHVSAVVCECRPGKAVCLQHARQLCECSTQQQRLLYRYSLAELDDLLEPVDSKLEDLSIGPRTAKRKPRAAQCGRSILASPLARKVKGRSVRHIELAETWVAQARSILEQCPSMGAIKDLVIEAEEFMWAGHEMDQVRQLESELATICKWAQDIAACTAGVDQCVQASGSKTPRVSILLAEQLLAVQPPCSDGDFSKLQALVASARTLRQQIQTALKSTTPLEIKTIEALQEEALRAPFELPELQQMKEMIAKAEDWSERAQKFLSTGKVLRNRTRDDLPDLEELHKLQSEAQLLPVVVGERSDLDAMAKQIEDWQSHANTLLQRAASLQEVEEVLFEAENLPVHLPEIELLEKRIGKVRDWVLRAQESLTDIQQPDNNDLSIKLLHDLLAAGELLDVYAVTEVKVVQKQLRKLSWMYSASKAVRELPTTQTVTDLLEESTRLELPESTVLTQIRDLADGAVLWELRAKQLLQDGGSMDEFTEAISSASGIQVAMAGLAELQDAVQRANDWRQRAQPLLGHKANGSMDSSAEPPTVAALQSLVADSKSLAVKLVEVEQLACVLVDVEVWISKSRELKEAVTIELGGVEANEESVSRMEDMVKKLGRLLKEGSALGFKVLEVYELQHLLYVTKWDIKASKLLLSGPTMKELKCLLAEGKELPVHVGKLERLKSALAGLEGWLSRTSNLLPAQLKGKCSEGQLEQLIAEAQDFDICLHRLWNPELARLQQILSGHRAWQKDVRGVLGGSVAHMSWSELMELQAIGQGNPVENREMELLNAELAEGGAWISRCFKAIVGRSVCGSFSLREVLLQMQKSVENALQLVGTDDKRGYKSFACICQDSLQHSVGNMLHCDSCEDWYHPTCLGLLQAHTRGQRQYVCPFCTAVCTTGVLALSDELFAKNHVTRRRPSLALLRELLAASRSIRCRMEEKELLECIIGLVETWQARLRSIIGPALVHYNFETDVDSYGLLAALKAVGGMEVQEDEGAKIKVAVAANAWRMRARKLVDGPPKPSLRALSRVVKEAVAIPVAFEDCILKELRQIEAYASQWASRAKEAIGDLGEMPVNHVQALMAEGERLPVALTRELAALKERSVLYCICRKPYDKDRAMIACDQCSEWYHYSCINLPEPDISDVKGVGHECEDSREFICANCLEKPHDGRVVDLDSSRTASSDEDPAFLIVRGKRSSRNGSSKSKSSRRQKWGGQQQAASNPSQWGLQQSNKELDDSPENSVSPSGRPCRRTAGRHSGFENFLLTRSR